MEYHHFLVGDTSSSNYVSLPEYKRFNVGWSADEKKHM